MCSEPAARRRAAAARPAAGPGAVLVLLLALLPAAAAAQATRVHREGEYGLWVREADGELAVDWFTRSTSPGFLEVWRGDARLDSVGTPTSFLHSASVPLPGGGDGEGDLLLRYGSAGDAGDRHETPVRLPLDPPRGPVELPPVDSLYVMGDVHGAFDRLLRVLRAAGLVDDGERWTGGGAHLVLLGDLFDRGPDVTRTLWFVYGLQAEARAAGGAVHVVLGNHEVMVMTRDLRYVSPKERSLAELRGTSYTRLFDVRRSVLGRWLASRPAVLRIGSVLLAHGGVSPRWAGTSLQALDDTLAAYVGGDIFHRWSDTTVQVAPVDSATLARRIDFFFGEESVFWHRGYVEAATGLAYAADGSPADSGRGAGTDAPGADAGDGAASRADSMARVLGEVLRRRGSRVHVVAHTPLPHVRQALDGRLIGVDLRRPASEMLLLVRRGEACRRYRMGEDGAAVPLAEGEGSGR